MALVGFARACALGRGEGGGGGTKGVVVVVRVGCCVFVRGAL